MHNHPSRNAKGKKRTPSNQQETVRKDTLAVYFALALICTFFIGSITYGFWQIIFPAIDSVTVVGGLLFGLLAQAGITIPTFCLVKSKQKRGNIIVSTIGLILGIFVLVASRSAGYEVQLSTPSSEESESEETISTTQGQSIHEGEGFATDGFEVSDPPLPQAENDLSSDTDILSPNTILTNNKSVSGQDVFVPQTESGSLLELIDATLVSRLPNLEPENKAIWTSMISDTVKSTINTDSQPDSSVINGNPSFTSKTTSANKLEDEIIANGMDEEKLREIIQLREDAFDIYKTSGIRHLLANNYHSLAKICLNKKDWDAAYSCYKKSIEFELSYIHLLSRADDAYFEQLYNIAVLFQGIGDIPYVEEGYRIEAYFLAASFFETACTNSFEAQNMKTEFLSNYYVGMVNHKLFLLDWSSKSRSSYRYLLDSLSYYQRSLEYSEYGKHRNLQYQYLADMSLYAQKYIQHFGKPKEMMESSQYYELQLKYESLSN